MFHHFFIQTETMQYSGFTVHSHVEKDHELQTLEGDREILRKQSESGPSTTERNSVRVSTSITYKAEVL